MHRSELRDTAAALPGSVRLAAGRSVTVTTGSLIRDTVEVTFSATCAIALGDTLALELPVACSP
jgi:hypothetical protein